MVIFIKYIRNFVALTYILFTTSAASINKLFSIYYRRNSFFVVNIVAGTTFYLVRK